MNTTNESPSNLLQTIDQAKINIDPLPRHYLADNADVRTRELYASFLGSVMLSNGRVSDVEHRLFTMLLVSLDIDTKVEPYLSNLETVEVEELVKKLDNDDKKQVLIFDSLLLTRCDSPLSIEQVELISELSDLLLLEKDDLNYTLYWTGKLLGIEVKTDLKNQNKYVDIIESRFRIESIVINSSSLIKENSILIKGNFKPSPLFGSSFGSNKREIKSNISGFLLSIELDNKIIVMNQEKFKDLIEYSEDYNDPLIENPLIILKMIILPEYLENWLDIIQELSK